MALTKIITKLWPVKGERNIFQAGINFVLKDDGVEVVNEDFTADYRKGSDPNEIEPDVIARAQTRVNRYKAEKQIYGAAAYDNAVTDINNGITL